MCDISIAESCIPSHDSSLLPHQVATEELDRYFPRAQVAPAPLGEADEAADPDCDEPRTIPRPRAVNPKPGRQPAARANVCVYPLVRSAMSISQTGGGEPSSGRSKINLVNSDVVPCHDSTKQKLPELIVAQPGSVEPVEDIIVCLIQPRLARDTVGTLSTFAGRRHVHTISGSGYCRVPRVVRCGGARPFGVSGNRRDIVGNEADVTLTKVGPSMQIGNDGDAVHVKATFRTTTPTATTTRAARNTNCLSARMGKNRTELTSSGCVSGDSDRRPAITNIAEAGYRPAHDINADPSDACPMHPDDETLCESHVAPGVKLGELATPYQKTLSGLPPDEDPSRRPGPTCCTCPSSPCDRDLPEPPLGTNNLRPFMQRRSSRTGVAITCPANKTGLRSVVHFARYMCLSNRKVDARPANKTGVARTEHFTRHTCSCVCTATTRAANKTDEAMAVLYASIQPSADSTQLRGALSVGECLHARVSVYDTRVRTLQFGPVARLKFFFEVALLRSHCWRQKH